MNLFNFLLLLLFFFRIQFGGSADSHFPFKGSWHTGELSKNAANLFSWADVIPCSERRSSSGKESLTSTVHLLCKRQEQQLHLWQGISPSRNKMTSVPNEALLVERENDLSTYNWNVFGLRYGKRQAVNAKKK